MIELKEARRRIGEAPDAPSSRVLARLLHALESGSPYPLQELHETDYDTFELGLEIIRGWRLYRYGPHTRKLAREPAAAEPRPEAPAAG